MAVKNEHNFAKNLSALMSRNNMKQRELANIINVNRSTISYWVRGKTEPSFEMLGNIAELFKVDYNTLLGENTLINSKRGVI